MYENYANFYDSIYSEKDYGSELKILLDFIEGQGVTAGSRVLDVGSGTGRHLEAMQVLGYQGVGIEPSGSMVKQARRRRILLHHGLLEGFRAEKSFDACTAFFAVLNHIPPSELGHFFVTVASILREKGILSVEIWAPHSANPSPTARRFRHEGRTYLRRIFATQITQNCWLLDIAIEETPLNEIVVREQHHIYKHSLEQLTQAGEAAGLQLVSTEPLFLNPKDSFHETYVFALVS